MNPKVRNKKQENIKAKLIISTQHLLELINNLIMGSVVSYFVYGHMQAVNVEFKKKWMLVDTSK